MSGLAVELLLYGSPIGLSKQRPLFSL